jgi:hypothetical protein
MSHQRGRRPQLAAAAHGVARPDRAASRRAASPSMAGAGAGRGTNMFGVAVEYGMGDGGLPDPPMRAACRAALVRQPGYRRRLALVADGWRRAVDFFLYDSPESARAALTGEAWQSFVAAHPCCRDAAPAVLVSESQFGETVVLLRSKAGRTRGGQACWRDHLANAEPDVVLW